MRRQLTPRLLKHAARQQRGVYAIEFGLVFMIFFGLVYATICYGVLFAFRSGMQSAAEDGARAALRYQTSLADRKTAARRETSSRLMQWLPAITCPATGTPPILSCVQASVEPSEATCSAAWEARCRIVVTVTARDLQQALPPLPQIALPSQLTVQARVLLDGRSL